MAPSGTGIAACDLPLVGVRYGTLLLRVLLLSILFLPLTQPPTLTQQPRSTVLATPHTCTPTPTRRITTAAAVPTNRPFVASPSHQVWTSRRKPGQPERGGNRDTRDEARFRGTGAGQASCWSVADLAQWRQCVTTPAPTHGEPTARCTRLPPHCHSSRGMLAFVSRFCRHKRG